MRTSHPRASRPARVDADPDCAEVGCEISELFRILGKTYVLDILNILTNEGAGPRRFVELQARLSISPNTLSDRLKELVQAGLLSRTAFKEIPPRVDYEATPKALDLRPVFASLADWATRHNLSPEQVPRKAVAVTST